MYIVHAYMHGNHNDQDSWDRNLLYPSDPPVIAIIQIGGLVHNNANNRSTDMGTRF